MRKILFLLALIPLFASAQQTQESINYWENKPIKYKTAGTQLKAAGTAFYLGLASAAAGGFISYVGNNSIQTRISNGEEFDHVGAANTVNAVSSVFYGGSLICSMVAFGKLISAGNLLEAERRQANKNTSLNFTGTGVSLVYKF